MFTGFFAAQEGDGADKCARRVRKAEKNSIQIVGNKSANSKMSPVNSGCVVTPSERFRKIEGDQQSGAGTKHTQRRLGFQHNW
jgi:hypothetical protein